MVVFGAVKHLTAHAKRRERKGKESEGKQEEDR